jgi:hypothetical protein
MNNKSEGRKEMVNDLTEVKVMQQAVEAYRVVRDV